MRAEVTWKDQGSVSSKFHVLETHAERQAVAGIPSRGKHVAGEVVVG